MKLNLGCGLVQKHESYWVNVDKKELVGVDQVVNLFQFPWPWGDDTVDEILCSHLLEHVPHEWKWSSGDTWPSAPFAVKDWASKLADLDGFYAFFAECWRVMKHGALAVFTVPYGASRYAMQDPTHVRFIVRSTIGYIIDGDSPDGTFCKNNPFRFACESLSIKGSRPEFYALTSYLGFSKDAGADKDGRAYANWRLEDAFENEWNYVAEMTFVLKAVKDAQG
jgi:hypothetical protein